jgi:hypothetical protein
MLQIRRRIKELLPVSELPKAKGHHKKRSNHKNCKTKLVHIISNQLWLSIKVSKLQLFDNVEIKEAE